jgi:hypothetical protein
MKDPKVIELVKQLNKDIISLNKTWAALHQHGVYVRMNMLGGSTYEGVKSLQASEITQHVAYIKSSKETVE